MSQVVAFRSFSDFDGEYSGTIHGTILPKELLQGAGFVAEISWRSKSGNRRVELPVYRISPLGCEIVVENSELSEISVGEELEVNIRVRDQHCEFKSVFVASVKIENNKKLLGLRWCELSAAAPVDTNRRKAHRWLSGGGFLPTGIAPNPAIFNDYIYFKVVDISSSGMQLSTSMRNKTLIPGVIIEGVFSLPMIGELSVRLKILNVRICSVDGKEYLSLGVKFQGPDSERDEALGQYLLQFGEGISVSALKAEGFRVRSVEDAISFSYVKNAQDYNDVLSLRKLTYSAVGKAKIDARDEELGDIFDAQSRIVCARHNGKMIGTLRISFHSDEEINEYERFVKLPEGIPAKSQTVVAGRVCTHPEFRNSDLVYGLMRQMILSAVQARKPYIMGASEEHLLPLYEKIGFRKLENASFTHSGVQGKLCHVVMMDVARTISGQDCSFKFWSRIYSDLADFVTRFDDVELSPTQGLKLSLMKTLGKFIRK
jgi:predicted GNAT family N-acyltransferase